MAHHCHTFQICTTNKFRLQGYMETQRNLKKTDQPLEQAEKKEERVSFRELYRFASGIDYVLIILGIVFALIAGCSFPFFAYLWGLILDAFLETGDPEKRVEIAAKHRNQFFYLGLGALVSSWIAFACWTILSQRLSVKCRKAYMKNLLRQEIGWFDSINQYQLSSQFNNDAIIYQRAIGQKVGSMFNIFSMFVCGLAIALAVRWTMALVVFAGLPIIGAFCVLFIYLIHKKDSNFRELYNKADGVLSQALLSIKTVKSMNGQNFQEKRYASFLNILKQKVWKYAVYAGVGTGLFFFVQYCAFAYGFWYGTHCVAGSGRCPPSVTQRVYTPGQATQVFFALFVGSFNFMQLVPNIQAILNGMYAAKRLYAIIDREPAIIKDDENGYVIPDDVKLKGDIEFQNVTFAYPTAPNRKILKNLSIKFDSNSVNALAGETGAGKSTVIQLIMRFYDIEEGRILIDGRDIKEYNLRSLRKKIGYVGQEPVLFDGSIRQNLMVGRPEAKQEELIEALRQSSSIDFVQKLPGQLDYDVGYGGSKLSGGQKQRIAIARAFLRNPSILLMDEATSALDRRNERLIQQAIDKFEGRVTKVVIAHRIKTIFNAKKVIVLNQGQLQEEGPFDKLKRFAAVDKSLYQEQQIIDDAIQKQIVASQHELNRLAEEPIFQKYKGSVFRRLYRYTKGVRVKFFIAVICSIIAGAVHPCSTLFLANTLNKQFDIYKFSSIENRTQQEQDLLDENLYDGERYMMYLFFVAIFIFFPFCIQAALFTKIGEDITQKIRKEVYHKLLRLPVSFFEERQNRGGKIATSVGVDSRLVNSLATSLVSTVLMNLSTISIALALAIIFDFRIGLIGLVAIPCMVISGFISMLFYGGFGDDNEQIYAEASRISQEAILNIKTVYSSNYSGQLIQYYDRKLQKPLDRAFKKGTKIGLMYGFSQLILEFTFGVLFYFGAVILRDNPNVTLLNIFYSIMAIAWGGWYAGNNFYFLPDVYAGKRAAMNLFKVLDTEDEDQAQIRQGSKLLKTPIRGDIQFKNVSFKFPMSPDPILKGLSLNIKTGQKAGLVGPSGSGKSTMIQLLERFYDPFEGQILLDKINIKDYDIYHLRGAFGYVNQEPSLFTGNFEQNVRYNKEDATQQQVKKATKDAQIYEYIMSNEEGFQKDVGIKGSKVSGGQKQRVAIARALIRKPTIFLMDQATSALDMQTEDRVQKKIDKRMKGKTLVSIAHRIETIKNSNKIYVFEKGELLEQGDYDELMRQKRYFYQLEKGLNLVLQ